MIKSLLTIIVLNILFCKVSFSREVEGRRQLALTEYNFVGLGYLLENPICSFWIIKHGVLVTAKHCFTHLGMDQESSNVELLKKLNIKFTQNKDTQLVIKSSHLKEIIFDSGINDLAIVTYSKGVTLGILDIPKINLKVDEVEELSGISTFGYPDQEHRFVLDDKKAQVGDLVESTGCRITGESSVIMPTINNPGYDGTLFDTTCATWFFVGGGPILKKNSDGSINVYGVITHTFDTKFDGSIDFDKVSTDKFGPYYSGNFSSFSNAESILDIINK